VSWVRDRFRARETYPFALCAGTGECLLRKRATISVHGDLQAWASFIYSSLEHNPVFLELRNFCLVLMTVAL
jgi:hypothetical protein